MRISLATLVIIGLTLCVGCGGDPVASVDAGMEMLDPVAAFDEAGTPVDIDLSCVGVWTEPERDGATSNFTLWTGDFQTNEMIPNIPFQYYPDNVVPVDASCTGTCVTTASNADSHVSLQGTTGAWFSYVVPPQDCSTPSSCGAPSTIPILTVQYNIPTPADGVLHPARAVTLATLNLIPAVLGVTRQSGTGIIAGTFYDCQDHRIANMQARAYRPDGTFIDSPVGSHTLPAYRYFNGEQQPDATQRWTKEDGLFGALNLPVPSDGEPIRIEGWGNVDGTWRMITCEKIRIFPDGVVAFNIRPDRADGPADCSE